MNPRLYSTTASISSVDSVPSTISVTPRSSLSMGPIWIIISAVLAIILGLVLYFTFLRKKNEGRFKGFTGWLYDFLNFKKLTIESVLKITYLMLTIFITLASFSLIHLNPLTFLLTLVFGNLGLRIAYEFSLLMILICRNTTEINSKLNKKDE